MEIDKLITLLNFKKYKQFNCHKIHKALLNSIKANKNPQELIKKLKKLKTAVEKAFREVESKKTSIKDDLLCFRISLESLLGHTKKADTILKKISGNKFSDINKEFVEKRGFDYFKTGKNMVSRNKNWRQALLASKKGTKKNSAKSKKKNSGFGAILKKLFGK